MFYQIKNQNSKKTCIYHDIRSIFLGIILYNTCSYMRSGLVHTIFSYGGRLDTVYRMGVRYPRICVIDCVTSDLWLIKYRHVVIAIPSLLYCN